MMGWARPAVAVAKVTEAPMTLVPLGNVTLAVEVEEDSEPLSGVPFTVMRVGTPSLATLTATLVPVGTFVACKFTVTGFVTVGLSVISGVARKVPCGLSGEAAPPIAAIRSVGTPVGGRINPGIPLDAWTDEGRRSSK